MFQKQTSVTTKLSASRDDEFENISAIKKIVWLIGEWSAALHTTPSLHAAPNENNIYVLFENSCFDCDELLAEYGKIIASIAKKHRISICGMLQNLEMGELTAYFDESGAWYKKSNISGQDFEVLSSVYIKLSFDKKEDSELTELLLQGSNGESGGAAFPRKYKGLLGADEFQGELEVTHFLYLMPNGAEHFSSILPQILTVGQLVELWILFLDEGITAVEFDMIYEQLKVSDSPCLLRLELSLQLALSEMSIKVSNDDSGFSVHKADGERIKFDFSSDSTAEKLFMKILFPISRL